MQNMLSEREELIDGMPRDARGFWQPEGGTKEPNPILAWPMQPKEILAWIKGYIYPWNLFYAALATVTWYLLTPDLDLIRTEGFQWDWILLVFLRNQIMLIVIVSAWHIWLWTRKAQGSATSTRLIG